MSYDEMTEKRANAMRDALLRLAKEEPEMKTELAYALSLPDDSLARLYLIIRGAI